MGEPDLELEAAIDRVGRERVFAYAAAHGWGPLDGPPKWVWWSIVASLRTQDKASPPEVREE